MLFCNALAIGGPKGLESLMLTNAKLRQMLAAAILRAFADALNSIDIQKIINELIEDYGNIDVEEHP